MKEPKLTIEQLKNYLGTGLKVEHPSTKGHFWKMSHDEGILNTISLATVLEIKAKLICYRLSDLDKFIPELGFVPITKLNNYRKLSSGRMSSAGWVHDTVGICDRDIGSNLTICGGGSWEGGTEEIDLHQFFNLYQQLFQWHFWVFGDEYFDAGLVIDKLNLGEGLQEQAKG